MTKLVTHEFSRAIAFVDEFINVDSSVYESIDCKMKNCFAIDNVFVKKFLTIDEFVTLDNIDLINFNILTQRLLIR